MRTFAQKPKTTQPTASAKASTVSRAQVGRAHDPNSILNLQRTVGNQAVLRLVQSNAEERNALLTGRELPHLGHDFARIPISPRKAGAFQTKLAINKPGDEYEQEADRVAEQVMRMPEPQVQGACPCGGGCPKYLKERPGQEPERLQTKRVRASGKGHIGVPSIVNEVLQAHGQPLDPETRGIMEPRFGHNFSQVRVHTDAKAAASAQAVSARAYTVGRDIVFGADHHLPGTAEGRRLLAHELVHVLQQEAAGVSMAESTVQRKSDDPTLCGGAWACAASPCEDPDPGRQGDGGTATSWTLKIMIDIEAPGAEDVGGTTVGHTYVEFVDSTGRAYTFGFYPDKSSGTPDPMFHPQVGGCIVHPDTAHKSCVDYTETFTLAQNEFDAALSFATTACKSPPAYNIKTWNCTTFAVEVAKKAAKSLPPTRGRVGSGMLSTIADNPNTLYEGLKRRDVGPTYGLTGDTEIRDAINGADVANIARIPTEEKLRIINRLLDGWVSDEDIAGIRSLYRNTSGGQRAILGRAIEARLLDLTDIGQRTQLRVILAGG